MTYTIPFSRWLQIDLDKLAANLAAMAQAVATPIIAVVKNDAYGFGALPCAGAFVRAGAAMLAVTTLDEALELREGGITAPILVFEPPLAAAAPYFARYKLTATVDGPDTLAVLAALGKPLDCHIKLNTGMNRFGANPADLPALLDELAAAGNITVTGLYSHLATALEPDDAFAKRQIAAFDKARVLVLARFPSVCCHLANSAGALKFPQARYDAVRLGSALYGQLVLAKAYGVALAEPFCAKARVAAVRKLAAGDTVGYGREFAAKAPMQVAVVPLGYGDGFGVQPAARPATVKGSVQTAARTLGKLALGRADRYVYFNDQRLNVLGRVAMQNMLVDATGVNITAGDVVNVPIRRTAASARLPRVYVAGDKVVAVRCISRALKDDILPDILP